MTTKVACLISTFTWMYGLSMSLPSVRYNIWQPGRPCSIDFVCTVLHNQIIATQFIILLVTLVATYAMIARAVQRKAISVASEQAGPSQSTSTRQLQNMKVLKTCSMVTGIFVLCTIPYAVLLVLTRYQNSVERLQNPAYMKFLSITYFLLLLNSSSNPMLYALRMPQLRKAVKEKFSQGSPSGQGTSTQQTSGTG